MKKITIVCIGTINHDLMKTSIENSTKAVTDCEDVIVFSDKNILEYGRYVEIKSDFNLSDYSLFCIKGLWPYIKTEFALIVQYDGMAVKKKHWSKDFYKYDYIGAPWPERFKWTNPAEKVGNGGFSLRSAKLLEALKDHQIRFHPESIKFKNEDILICQGYRKYLESQHNIKYAPIEIADKFSTEWTNVTGETFGFHGIWNAPFYYKEKTVIEYIENLPAEYWIDDKLEFFNQALKLKNYNSALEVLKNKLTLNNNASSIAK